MRSYVYVDAELKPTAYMPPGNHGPAFNISRANGDRVSFSSTTPASPGYYRAQTSWQENRWYVDVGKRISPLEESERLQKQANSPPKDARARLPGVEGQAHMARMADAASAAAKDVSAYFARLLVKLNEEFGSDSATLGMRDEQGFDLAEVRRIANLINYGLSVEDIRDKVPEMSDSEFFYAYKAAERYLKQDQDR